MNLLALPLVIALTISACDSSSPLEITNQPGSAPTPGEETTSVIEQSTTHINGNISLYNNATPTSDISIKLRDTNIVTTMRATGEFLLELPPVDVERTITLDVTGSSIIPKSMEVVIPANAKLIPVNAAITERTVPITFNLDEGGTLQNVGSPTRVKVTVPPNAFQFADGSNATGDAQISITEIDITDLDGASAWAPNLIGISQGMTEPQAIYTFGMSDFHFSQSGRVLQLQPGVIATIAMDLVSPYMWLEGDGVPSPAQAGGVIPLWHYDVEDMVWKEEGEALILADNESDSGFSVAGNVDHFSTWNVDATTPQIKAYVVIRLVDGQGAPRNDLTVKTYHTTSRIPLDAGPGWYGETQWRTARIMSPSDNSIDVLANQINRAADIATVDFITDFTTMEFIIDDIMVDGIGPGTVKVNDFPLIDRKRFNNYDDNNTVIFYVVVDDTTPAPEAEPAPEPGPTKLANILVEIIDLFGNIDTRYSVQSYTITGVSNNTDFSNTQSITPPSTEFTVEANDQSRLNSDDTQITMEISLSNLVIRDNPDARVILPGPITKVFSTLNNNDTVIFRVAITEQ